MPQQIKDLERVIRRTSMNRGQITLLKYLYEADGFVNRDEIVNQIRWGNHDSFTGVLSAFSNRINNTEGITDNPGYEAFIERRKLDNQEQFRLRHQAKEAINQVEKLLTTFERPLSELLQEGITVEFDPISLAESLSDRKKQETIGWSPKTKEDELLKAYWNQIGGTIITEVEVGAGGPSNWPPGSKRRQLDGLRFRSEYRDEICDPAHFTQEQLRDIVRNRHVEVIEVKQKLNRPVIGQAIAGKDLLSRDYSPGTIEPVVICEENDPALEWVCRKRGIRVEIIDQKELR